MMLISFIGFDWYSVTHGSVKRYILVCFGALIVSVFVFLIYVFLVLSEVWAAVMYPRRVAGLVLFMVPTMWATRQARRGALEAKADALRASEPNRAEVMTGAARADFPPREDLERLAATGIPAS